MKQKQRVDIFVKLMARPTDPLFKWLCKKPLRLAVCSLAASRANKSKYTNKAGYYHAEFSVAETEYALFGLSCTQSGQLRRVIKELIAKGIFTKVNRKRSKGAAIYCFIWNGVLQFGKQRTKTLEVENYTSENREHNREHNREQSHDSSAQFTDLNSNRRTGAESITENTIENGASKTENWESKNRDEIRCSSQMLEEEKRKKKKEKKFSYKNFILDFNEIVSKAYKKQIQHKGDSKSLHNFKKLVRLGYSRNDFRRAIFAATKNAFIMGKDGKNSKRYLTPEFISREDKFDFYLSEAPELMTKARPDPIIQAEIIEKRLETRSDVEKSLQVFRELLLRALGNGNEKAASDFKLKVIELEDKLSKI